jgi:hypothetical protein
MRGCLGHGRSPFVVLRSASFLFGVLPLERYSLCTTLSSCVAASIRTLHSTGTQECFPSSTPFVVALTIVDAVVAERAELVGRRQQLGELFTLKLEIVRFEAQSFFGEFMPAAGVSRRGP